MPGKFGRFNDTKEEQKGSHSFDYWAYGVVFTYLQSNIQRFWRILTIGRRDGTFWKRRQPVVRVR